MYSVKATEPKKIETWWETLPNETIKETAWERDMHLSGLGDYERKSYGADLSETASGQRMIRKLLRRSEAAIKERQRSLVHNNRLEQSVRASVILVPADTCALITLRHLIDVGYSVVEEGQGLQDVCLKVAKSIEMELNFRHWVTESKKQAREFAKEKGWSGTPQSIAEKILKEEGSSARTVQRWRKTFGELNEYRWTLKQRHYCGEALVRAVVDALPDTFEIITIKKRGKTRNVVLMTEEAKKKFDQMEGRIADMQVSKKPMLAKPTPWEMQE